MAEQLSDEELKRLRELITADARRQWLVSSIAGAARWIAVVLGAWLALRGLISEAMPWVK